jgi:hypothetical protein
LRIGGHTSTSLAAKLLFKLARLTGFALHPTLIAVALCQSPDDLKSGNDCQDIHLSHSFA